MKANESTAQYRWEPQPLAAKVINELLQRAVAENPWVAELQQRLLTETGTRLIDWLDHIAIEDAGKLTEAGFRLDEEGAGMTHSGGLFPIVLPSSDARVPMLAIKVESIDAFLSVHGLDGHAEVRGEPNSPLRLGTIDLGERGRFRVVERHGYQGFALDRQAEQREAAITRALESFRDRPRPYDQPMAGFKDALIRFGRAEAEIGQSRACDIFFQAEREYWQARNKAARTQLDRQNRLGLGWANHDHHTYRCSREGFAPLVQFLETAGFHCRERFYAGSDAGWGAQVLEHDECGIVVFADVDMTEEEVVGDFAHDGLPANNELGTVGLWCKLHGDSFLSAGMHHLECQFDFDAARAQLAKCGIETMAPFTDFPYLRQAFTKGEMWKVDSARLQQLAATNAISPDDAQRFASTGALGSHLEILERNDGYKGFNQTGISEIILATNPKTAL